MSGSASELSGDVPLGLGDKLRYIAVNAFRNASVSWRWTAYRPSGDVLAGEHGQSPSRLITEDFIRTRLSQLVPSRPLNVLEVGCGSGSMVRRLAALGMTGSYTGIDILDKFSIRAEDVPGFTIAFQKTDAHHYQSSAPIDLVISVSALEHIPNDAALVRRLASMMSPDGVQVHVLPAGAALWTYLWHGYRQYTPRSLTARFGPEAEIVGLGGFGSFLLHLFAITPEIAMSRFIRKRFPGLYSRLLRAALVVDRWAPVCPTAHVVIARGPARQGMR